VAGVRVVDPPYGDSLRMAPFSVLRSGMSVALLVRSRDEPIAAIDREESRLDYLTDQYGTNLLRLGRSLVAVPKTKPIGVPTVSRDRRAALVHLHGEGVPGENSSVVRAAGTLIVLTGRNLRTEWRTVSVSEGETVPAGPFTLEVAEMSPPIPPPESSPEEYGGGYGAGDGPMREVDVTVTGPLAQLKTVKVRLPGTGSTRAYDMADSYMGAVPDEGRATRTLLLRTEVDRIEVAVEYWYTLDRARVYFSVDAGLSLR
jgi:hypothetical protein